MARRRPLRRPPVRRGVDRQPFRHDADFPRLYAFFVFAIIAAGFGVVRVRGVTVAELFRPRLLALGGLTALRTSVTYVAFSLAIASRVSIVLQLSILLNVLAGGVLLTERDVRRNLLGDLSIVTGIVLTL